MPTTAFVNSPMKIGGAKICVLLWSTLLLARSRQRKSLPRLALFTSHGQRLHRRAVACAADGVPETRRLGFHLHNDLIAFH